MTRVHYGGIPIPAAGAICLGGAVKYQRLAAFFPDTPEDFDVLYFVSSSLPEAWLRTYWTARQRGRRVVWNQSAVTYQAVWPELNADDDNLLLEQGLHAADYVIYQSEFSRQVADRCLGPFGGPGEVLYNAVDTQFFTPRRRPAARELTLLLAGTQYRRSSLEIALSALAALRCRIPRSRLLVTGSMCWTPDCDLAMRTARLMVETLGVSDAVEFVGEYSQADAPDVFGRADILLHTRYDDLCPNVVIEAMACGVPVVYSGTGGTPELVGDGAGVGVPIVHSWDVEQIASPEQWAEALERVAAVRSRFAEAARERAVARFDLQPWIARHSAIFERVLTSPPSGTDGRAGVNTSRRAPLRLVELQPSRTPQCQPFNIQPDGRSALAIAAANATHATMVLLDDEPQDTTLTNASQLSIVLPANVVNTPGVHRVRLAELLRTSNELHLIIEESGALSAATQPAVPSTVDARSAPTSGNLVSIVIPCFNQGRFLAEAIESALSQSHEPKEVIVVDDGSTDETAAVASRYPVRYVRQRRAGESAARNRGVRESAGAYLVFLDADDRLLPGALAAGLAGLEINPECSFVFGRYRHIAADGSFLREQPEPAGSSDLYLALLHYNHIGMLATVMFRREVFSAVGGFNERLDAAVDYELYLRIGRRFPFAPHQAVVAEYRKHGATVSSDPWRMLRTVGRVLHEERRYLGEREEYLTASAEGLKGNRAFYLTILRAEAQRSRRRALPWSRRVRVAAALLRWDMPGFAQAFMPHAYCTVHRWRDAIRNRMIRLLTRPADISGLLVAEPNPVRIPAGRAEGPAATTLDWRAEGTTAVEIRVNRPDGPLFSNISPGGCATTGEWVTDRTRFYLQDVSDTRRRAGRTLAVVTVNVIPE